MSTDITFDEDLFNKMFDEMISSSDSKPTVNVEPKKEKRKVVPVTKKSELIKGQNQTPKQKEEKKEEKKEENAKKVLKNVTKTIKKKKEKKKVNSPKAFGREQRFTEPKKRNILSRIILQEKLKNYYFEDLEDDYECNYINQNSIDNSKNAKKRSDRRLYKQVQAYEDAVEDVSVRRGWTAFKVSLAGLALAGAFALSSYAYKEVNSFWDDVAAKNQIVTLYNVDAEKRDLIEDEASNFKNKVKEKSGYHFDNLSDEEFADGYIRILNNEKKIDDNTIKSAMYKFHENRDQRVLDEVVKRAFGEEEYQTFSEAKKRDYRQLSFELLPIAKNKLFSEGIDYIRNPIVMDELEVRDYLKEKGYKIELRVNGDEKETIKNLGNIMHRIHEMDEMSFKSVTLQDNGQQQFFDELMLDVLGEDNYNKLSKKYKRDYEQIIYEWLPENAKQYIKDPIEIERNQETEEIGDR